MKSRFLLLIFMAPLWLFFVADAQCPGSTPLNFSTALYTQENGLPTNVLTRMAKDSTGYRYFCGVDKQWVRYDGVGFSRFHRPTGAFFNRTEPWSNTHGNLQYKGQVGYLFREGKDRGVGWAVINDSLHSIDTLTKTKRSYRLPAAIMKQQLNTTPDNEICWLITGREVYRFELSSQAFVRVALPVEIPPIQASIKPMQIHFRSDGVPMMPFHNVVLQLDHFSTAVKVFCNILPGQFNVDYPQMVIADHLYGANAGGIFNDLNLTTGTVSSFDIGPFAGKQSPDAISYMADYKGALLIGTTNTGMFQFNTCNHSIQRVQYEHTIKSTGPASAVLWIAVDEGQVIWVETGAGLIKMEVDEQKISSYRPSTVEPGTKGNDCDNIRAVYLADSGHLVIGSLTGAYVLDLASKKIRPFMRPFGNTAGAWRYPIGSVAGDGKGTLFLGNYGYHGILLYNQATKKQASVFDVDQRSDFFCNVAHCQLYDSRHTLWVGNSNGILRIEQLDRYIESGFKGKPATAMGFPTGKGRQAQFKTPFYAMAEDGQGNIWAGALDGLYRYDRAKAAVTRYTHDPADPRSISDNEVRSICLSKNGGVWIGTLNGGLNHLDTATGVFTAYTTDNGLPNNAIYTMLEDNSGHLWLGTNAGLCRFNKTDHSVRNYTPRDGIQDFEFNTNAACPVPDGLLCFGGTAGFNVFHPDSLSDGFAPPKAVITRFKIFDKEYPVPNSVLVLNHEQNSLSFEFASLSYYRSSDHQYAYMLEGVDKDWIKPGNRHFTNYAHLAPGRYTFKVRAANYTGVWSKETTTLTFMISPAWYDTWWSRLAMALLVAAGMYGLYRYRIGQMQKLYTVRDHIASDLHDEIGSTLSSISLMSGMMQRKLQAGDTAVNSLLLQISSNTSKMLEALGDIVWAVNSSNDRFDNVVDRMRAFAIELLEPADIQIDFAAGNDLSDLKLDMQQRKNLYLVFKEALNNTVKYSTCKNVTIRISRKGTKTLMLEVKDDGKGFDLEKINTENISLSGNGIRNMKKRAAELGGMLDIVSSPENGTSIFLVFTV